MVDVKEGFKVFNGYKLVWRFVGNSSTVFITFDNRSEVGDFSNRIGWGGGAFKKNNISYISFMSLEPCWFLKEDFSQCMSYAVSLIKESGFERVVGYSGSMGGFALLFYRNELLLDEMYLFNPITTLDQSKVPWEDRFKKDANLFKKKEFNDSVEGKTNKKIKVTVFYDPFEKKDAKHLQRIRKAIHSVEVISLPGAGHGTPIYLSKVGELKNIMNLINDGAGGEVKGYLKSLRTRQIYYNLALCTQRVRGSEWMRRIYLINKVINTHQNIHEKMIDLSVALRHANPLLSTKLLKKAYEIKPDSKAVLKVYADIYGDAEDV